MAPSPEFGNAIHARLLAGDRSARADAAVAYLNLLRQRLQARYPGIRDPSLLDDAAADALLDFLEHPERFDPTRSDLFRYLLMSARGDLRNALDKERRREAKGISLLPVEEVEDVRNQIQEDHEEMLDALGVDTLEELRTLTEGAITDPVDRRILELMLEGERDTAVFAEVLGLKDADPHEQEREVKRHKDRIKVRLKRLGERLRTERGKPDA